MSTSSPRSRYEFGSINNLELNLHDQCTNVGDSLSSEQSSRSLNQYSTMSSKSGSQFKVSEIVNPDGSVTIRNLLIQEDGMWTKQEQEINNRQSERLYRSSGSSGQGTNFDRHNRTQIMTDGMPAMNRADSFESSSSYSSDECAVKYSSEAIAHRMRRQRLAQSSRFFDATTNCTTGNPSPKRAQHEGERLIRPLNTGSTSPTTRSPEPFRRSRTMNTMMYSPSHSSTPCGLRKVGSKNTETSHKHVAFSKPLSLAKLQPDEHVSSSKQVVNDEKHDSCHRKEKNNFLIDIYNDIDRTGCRSFKQSFSSGHSDADSSIFDDVAQSSNVDKILGRLEGTDVRQSASQRNQNRISYVDDDKEKYIPNLYSVTVHKTSQMEKIGIYVHLNSFPYGDRLVISNIASDGKFANTRIKEGDIVVSINGEDMLEDPQLEKALSIVTSATDSVTIVVHRDFEVSDGQSTSETSFSSISKDLSTITYATDHSQTRTLFRGAEKIDIGAQEFNNERLEAKVVKDDATKRERMTGDGSMLISKDSETLEPISMKMNESWKLSGIIVVSIENISSGLEKTDLLMNTKKTSTGHILYISDISPSSMFTKSPLRIGDIIISINSISLYDNPNVDDAYSALGKAGKRITIVAKKGEESLSDFLLHGRRRPVLPRNKIIHARRESTNTTLTTQTSGTMGTTVSGESTQDIIKGGAQSNNSTRTDNGNGSKSGGRGLIYSTLSGDSSIDLESVTMEKDLSCHEAFENPSKFILSPSSSRVTIIKNTHEEDIGIEVVEVAIGSGILLAVSKITPRSPASSTDLRVGDVILTVNGSSFMNNPDARKAAFLVREAQREVCIEFKKFSSFSPAVLLDMQKSKSERTRVLKTNRGANDVNEYNSCGHISNSRKLLSTLKEFEQNQKFASMNNTFNTQREEHECESSTKSLKLQAEGKVSKQKRFEKCQKVLVTVTKEHQKQKIGIDFAVLNNKLVLTEVSSTGLLRNAPLVFGDTILSINGVSFQLDPVLKDAFSVIKSAGRRVTLEILKTEHLFYKRNVSVSTKSCIPAPLFCKRRRKIEYGDLATKFVKK